MERAGGRARSETSRGPSEMDIDAGFGAGEAVRSAGPPASQRPVHGGFPNPSGYREWTYTPAACAAPQGCGAAIDHINRAVEDLKRPYPEAVAHQSGVAPPFLLGIQQALSSCAAEEQRVKRQCLDFPGVTLPGQGDLFLSPAMLEVGAVKRPWNSAFTLLN